MVPRTIGSTTRRRLIPLTPAIITTVSERIGIIRDNISENLTTSGGGVRLQGGGHVKNCRIFNNYLNTSGGGGADGG